MEDLVSIIIPVYKVEKYLRECVDSVLSQTYKNLEIILVDDGSPDNCPQICDEYANLDTRVKVIHKENGGVSSARNIGLDNATGKYVSFVDSDDFIDKDYMFLMHKNAVETGADMVISGYYEYTGGKAIKHGKVKPCVVDVDASDKKFTDFIYSAFIISKNNAGAVWNKLLLRENIIITRFNTDLKVAEDSIFVMNAMFESKRISMMTESLYYYRQNNASVMHSYKGELLQNQLYLMEEYEKVLSKLQDEKTRKALLNNLNSWNISAVFIHELKYRVKGYRQNIQKVRKSELYKYFKLKNLLKIGNFKMRLKTLAAWFLVKTRLV